jgi:hypothetical protein
MLEQLCVLVCRHGRAWSVFAEESWLERGRMLHWFIRSRYVVLPLAAEDTCEFHLPLRYVAALQVYQSVSGLHHPDTFNCLTSLVSLLR